jgi:hypothetical protein
MKEEALKLANQLDGLNSCEPVIIKACETMIRRLVEELDKASEQSWYRFNKNGYAKPLTNDEIREIGDACELKNNGILNWIDFAREIEERHGIK